MRYLPLTEPDRRAMLAAIGARAVDDLFVDVPLAARLTKPVDLPPHAGELEVERRIKSFAAKNVVAGDVPFFLGAGNYRHHVPASVDALIQRGEFLTSYTPYQPEVSQGTLQYLFEFQTQVALLTGMEVANASMYDGATATAEAAAMACRITKRPNVILSGSVHPHYRSVTATTLQYTGHEVDALAPDPLGLEDLMGRVNSQTACVVVQNPGFFGGLRDLGPLAAECHAEGALLVVVVAEPVSLGLIKSPGEMGADIVVAEGQSLGNALNFGGPGLGLFATREKYMRQMPGRLVGEARDKQGRRGFVLTLSTREQHIRREKATSNICTNQGLVALMCGIFMSVYGREGMKELAKHNLAKAHYAAEQFKKAGATVLFEGAPRFNEFVIQTKTDPYAINDKLLHEKIIGGFPLKKFYPELSNASLWCCTETTTKASIDAAAKEVAL